MASFFDKPIKSPKSPKIAKFQKVPRGNEILETFQNSDISGLIGLFLALDGYPRYTMELYLCHIDTSPAHPAVANTSCASTVSTNRNAPCR